MTKNPAMPTDESVQEVIDGLRWRAFDRHIRLRATTRAELRAKLEFAQWALTERYCDEQAGFMIASCLKDLGKAQD